MTDFVVKIFQTDSREWMISASLSLLCLVKPFYQLLLRHPHYPAYYNIDYLAAICNFVLLTIAWRGIRMFLRHASHPRLSKALPLVHLIPLILFADFLRPFFLYAITGTDITAIFQGLGKAGLLLAAVLVGYLGFLVGWRYAARFQRILEVCLAGIFPAAILILCRVAWVGLGVESAPGRETTADAVGTRASSARVVWIIFDEMDQRLSFPGRPARLSLPELDRFRDSAIYATDALPPADNTLLSIPSILAGKVVHQSDLVGHSDGLLLVTFTPDGERMPWDEQIPDVFSKAHRLGVKVAVDGVYLPYCLLFQHVLTQCADQPQMGLANDPDASLYDRMARQILVAIPGSPAMDAVKRYSRMLQHAKETSADRGLGLVYVHLSVPHFPFIYNRAKARTEAWAFLETSEGYVNNLALADRTLGEIRVAMEQAGVWNDTTVLVTSDHPWRDSDGFDGKSDPRVPFLLKLAGQSGRIDYDQRFNTVVTHDLILSLLTEEVSTPEEAIAFLDREKQATAVSRNLSELSPTDHAPVISHVPAAGYRDP